MEEGQYKSISKISEGFYREKGSKFTAYAIPCSDEEEAKTHIKRLWKENPQACHVCFAWRFGIDRYENRFSDDGEPSNSAGKPIFAQIESFELTNILIAVVRIYGGTNLGVGGLIRAYKTAAKEALEKATIENKRLCNFYELSFPAEHTGIAMKTLSSAPADIIEHGFAGNQPSIRFKIPVRQSEHLIGQLETQQDFELKFLKTS